MFFDYNWLLLLLVFFFFFWDSVIELRPVERAWQTVFDNMFNKGSDVQEGEFVFFEIKKFKFLFNSFTTDGRGGFVS